MSACAECAQGKLFDKGQRIQLSFSVSKGSAAKEDSRPRDVGREPDRPSNAGAAYGGSTHPGERGDRRTWGEGPPPDASDPKRRRMNVEPGLPPPEARWGGDHGGSGGGYGMREPQRDPRAVGMAPPLRDGGGGSGGMGGHLPRRPDPRMEPPPGGPMGGPMAGRAMDVGGVGRGRVVAPGEAGYGGAMPNWMDGGGGGGPMPGGGFQPMPDWITEGGGGGSRGREPPPGQPPGAGGYYAGAGPVRAAPPIDHTPMDPRRAPSTAMGGGGGGGEMFDPYKLTGGGGGGAAMAGVPSAGGAYPSHQSGFIPTPSSTGVNGGGMHRDAPPGMPPPAQVRRFLPRNAAVA
jgi:hypothetical protein